MKLSRTRDKEKQQNDSHLNFHAKMAKISPSFSSVDFSNTFWTLKVLNNFMLKEADDLASDLLAITDKGLKYCKKLRYLATDDVPYCSLCPLSSLGFSLIPKRRLVWWVCYLLFLIFDFYHLIFVHLWHTQNLDFWWNPTSITRTIYSKNFSWKWRNACLLCRPPFQFAALAILVCSDDYHHLQISLEIRVFLWSLGFDP